MHTFEQAQAMRYYRQRFSDMPVGDALSGAAYGEYLKSKALGAVIGVVAAVAAVWTGGATLAAYSAGTVGIGAAISAGAMVAGGVMSGVGIVTGNKKLTKIGGILSLAGGVGAMAFGTSAGPGLLGKEAHQAGNLSSLTGGSTEAQASLMSEVASASKTANAVQNADAWAGQLDISAATPAAPDVAQASNTAAFGPAETQSISNLEKSIPEGTMNLNTDQVPMGDHTGGAGTGMADAKLSVDAAPPQAPATQSAAQPAPAQGGGATPATDAMKNGEIYGPTAPPAAEKGFFTGAGKFAKDNKELIEIGGKMMMGAMDPENELTGAKAALYKAQTTAAEATARNTDTVTEAQKQKMAADEQQRKNANTQILMLDPRDPQYAQKKAEAAAKGIPTMDMVTPAAGPVTMGNVDYTKSANQWVPDRPAQQPQGILQTAQR